MKIDWQRKRDERGTRTEPLWTLHELADALGVTHGVLRHAMKDEGGSEASSYSKEI